MNIFKILLLLPLFFTQNCFAVENETKTIEKAILYHVNKYRIHKGLNPLIMNSTISAEARKHSQDMSRHIVKFGHANFLTRIKYIYSRISNCDGGAENVAAYYKNANIVVQQWLKSPAHKKNIDGNYNMTGIGVARDQKGKLFFTQLFIKTKYFRA
jgi:uncharacterized protein YkwD